MAEKELKICEYCGKEYKPRVTDQKYCGKQCRWDYNNALKAQKLEAVDKQVNGVYTPSHASESVITAPVEVAPKIEQPRAPESDVREMLKTLITLHVESTQQQIKVAEMQEKNIEAQRQNMELQKRTLDFLEQLGLGGFSISQQSAPPVPTFDTKDELPVVEVKKSKASSNSSSNFLNSIMALNG